MTITRKSFSLAVAALAVAGLSFAGATAVAQQGVQGREGSAGQPQGGKNIIETAKEAGQFNTLAKALTSADLVETLSGEGPFTVFAPNDAAFKALPTGTLDTLLKPENKAKLQQILLYHVASGKVMAADVTKVQEVETAQGEAIKVTSQGGKVMLNGKTEVIKADITASNGVIHVINGVLMPTAGNDRGSDRGTEGARGAGAGEDDGM